MSFALVSLLCVLAQDAAALPAPALLDAGEFEVRLHDKACTTLRWKDLSRPVLWPLLDMDGRALTRAWPFVDAAADAKDHVHQKSLWFAHGDVNGVDFWTEGDKCGRVVVRAVECLARPNERADERVALRLRCDWVGPNQAIVCTEVRDLVFTQQNYTRNIDIAIALHASHGPLTLGDTKEGTMALRVAQGLCFDQEGGTGHALSSEGRRDKEVWGTRARWVAFDGEVDGARVGVALLDHKDNVRHPTTWHARPYGLLAANPFGLHDFEKAPPGSGVVKVDAGATLSLRYRVVLFAGAAQREMLDAQWRAFTGAAVTDGTAQPAKGKD